MMDEQLVGYLLNALDPDAHREVQAHLQTSADARGRLEILRRNLEPLAADQAPIDPPAGLAIRTLGRVAEYCCRELPRAPVDPAARAPAPGRPFWRRADVLVAATILLTVLGVGLSLVANSRAARDVVECQNNLRVFYGALKAYADHHTNRLPNVADVEPPRNVAGMVAPLLIDAGTLPRDANVGCPGNGARRICPLTLQPLQELNAEIFKRRAEELICCYAYSLGYQDAAGYHGPRLDRDQRTNRSLPIMADRPPRNSTDGNSANHGGTGQNVLFQDGHVGYYRTRYVGLNDDDIYLNRAGRQAAGLDSADTVLGSSESTP